MKINYVVVFVAAITGWEVGRWIYRRMKGEKK